MNINNYIQSQYIFDESKFIDTNKYILSSLMVYIIVLLYCRKHCLTNIIDRIISYFYLKIKCIFRYTITTVEECVRKRLVKKLRTHTAGINYHTNYSNIFGIHRVEIGFDFRHIFLVVSLHDFLRQRLELLIIISSLASGEVTGRQCFFVVVYIFCSDTSVFVVVLTRYYLHLISVIRWTGISKPILDSSFS